MIKKILFATLFCLPLFLVGLANAQDNRELARQAMQDCAQSLGIERPQPGQRPSEENREKMKENHVKMSECMKEKGFNLPEGRLPRGGFRPSADGDSNGGINQ